MTMQNKLIGSIQDKVAPGKGLYTLAETFDADRIGQLVVDIGGAIHYANPKIAKFLGIPVALLVGKNMFNLPSRSTNGSNHNNLAENLRGVTIDPPKPIPVIFTKPNGSMWHTEAAITQMRDGLRRWSFKNVTSYILGNLALQRTIKDLDARKTELELALEKARVLTSTISHEMRGPLIVSIKLIEQHLEDIKGLNRTPNKKTPMKTRNILEKALNASKLSLEVMNNTLDLEKIEAGKLIIEAINFSLKKDIVNQLKDLYMEQAKNRGIHLIFKVADNSSDMFKGDPSRILQVLMNYMGNALKFTQNGSVTLEIKSEQTNGQQMLRFEVIDTGIGISPDSIQNLFQSFGQADSTISRKYGGTGLGLDISKKLTRLMGGETGVVSKENVGSTFWFTVPLVEGESIQSVAKPSETEPGFSKYSPARILVAEDDEITQMILEGRLKEMGYQSELIIFVNNGQEAVDAIRSATIPFDLFITDSQMPVLNGFDTTRQIRELTKALPIVGHSAGDYREQFIQAGATAFIDKGAKAEMFQQILEKHLPLDLLPQIKALPKNLLPEPEKANLKFLGDSAEDIIETIDFFIEILEKDTIQIKEMLRKNDLEPLKLIAHRLRPTFAGIGRIKEAAILESIERSDDSAEITRGLALFEKACINVIKFLIEEREKLIPKRA